ncbi:MAG: hypothetical protein GF383_12885 [Candidatus Lokiarchaeota archaeon]|nr:hypothetical protein [Candidatus Lokiarchaeota archaeon]
MADWKNGRPESPGLYWVALEDKSESVRLIMVILGFDKVLHYRTLFPLEFIRNPEFKYISALENCLGYMKVTKPEFNEELLRD